VRDRDGDKISDDKDACPDEPGPTNPDPKLDGCPPNHDADGDGVADFEDACPTVKGVRSPIPSENGCPDPDPDKDTFVGADDKCPNEPETWNGYKDDDGCPDEAPKKARPVVILKEKKDAPPTVELSVPIKLTASNEVDPASVLTLRALASELAKHPEWKLSVGARVSPKEGEAAAEARAKAIVAALRKLVRRDAAVEVAAWNVVKAAPRAAEYGVGMILTGPNPMPAEKPASAKAAEPKPPKAPPPPPPKKK
jgi:hypothetical protein